VVDLPDRLMRFIGAVYKGQPDVARFHLKLGQDGVAKGLGCNSGAIGDEKYCSMGHGCKF
jgi:hypothetical protein